MKAVFPDKIWEGADEYLPVLTGSELIPDNGRKLEAVVLELAHLNGLEEEFIEWLENYNCFCNSLADRTVPCQPDVEFLSSVK